MWWPSTPLPLLSMFFPGEVLGCQFLLLPPTFSHPSPIFELWECCYPLETTRKGEPGAPSPRRSGLDKCAHFCPQSVPPSSRALPRLLPGLWVRMGDAGAPLGVPQVPQPGCCSFQGKSGKDEREARTLQLRSLQYLERYIFLILFNAYLHLEKKDSWQRPFSLWMREVRLSQAGIQEFTGKQAPILSLHLIPSDF